MYGAFLLVFLLVIALLSSGKFTPDKSDLALPEGQRSFLARIASAQKAVDSAANSLLISELLESRDNQLSAISIVDNWRGTVIGIQEMQGKGGISIDIGGTKLIAGVHLFYGLDTLVNPSESRVYSKLLELRSGDPVQFSGRFVVHNGSLVEMSYTESGSIAEPEFLFEFSSLERVSSR